ncbi:hypothetical protein BC830DRAFT_1085414 [Chytriomyces sp. MP71]|nr:hypothetical protein BC830DRAFT_1085414 [Chytriomyces sp. MP71]
MFANTAALALLNCQHGVELEGTLLASIAPRPFSTTKARPTPFTAEARITLLPLPSMNESSKVKQVVEATEVVTWDVVDSDTDEFLGVAAAFPHVQVMLSKDGKENKRTHGLKLAELQRLLFDTNASLKGASVTKAALCEAVYARLSAFDVQRPHGNLPLHFVGADIGLSNLSLCALASTAVTVPPSSSHILSPDTHSRVATNFAQPTLTATDESTSTLTMTHWCVESVDSMAVTYEPSSLAHTLSRLLAALTLDPARARMAVERQHWRPGTCAAQAVLRCAAVEAMLFGLAHARGFAVDAASPRAVARVHGIEDTGKGKKRAAVEIVAGWLRACDRVEGASGVVVGAQTRLVIPGHLRDVFEAARKKDDLADSLLIAVAHHHVSGQSLFQIAVLSLCSSPSEKWFRNCESEIARMEHLSHHGALLLSGVANTKAKKASKKPSKPKALTASSLQVNGGVNEANDKKGQIGAFDATHEKAVPKRKKQPSRKTSAAIILSTNSLNMPQPHHELYFAK